MHSNAREGTLNEGRPGDYTTNPAMPFMAGSNIYLTGGGWIYEVWFHGRVIVVGCCATFEAAMRAAAHV